ncbi:hypothetical protein JCM5350_001449 [Sporobolomyces pararoseus]
MDLGRRKIVDTNVAYGRALTYGLPRRTFAKSGLSFREYNEAYEDWLKDRYRDEIEPYTKNRSSIAFDPYLTETALECMVETQQEILSKVRSLERLESMPELKETLSFRWNSTGVHKREEIVLEIWEDHCRRSEAAGCIWLREDCPELTLEWVTGFDQEGIANWIRLWEQQRQTEEEREKSEKEGDLPFSNLRNEKWDRVNGVFEIEKSPVPVKKSVRAFVQDGVLGRNFELRQFLLALVVNFVGGTVNSPLIVQRPTRSGEKDENDMLLALQSQGVNMSRDCRAQAVICVYCNLGGSTRPVKLKCSSCWEKVNRSVRYCSISCQHQHWNIHKQICGKPLKDTLSIPSFASSAPSTPSKPSTAAHQSESRNRLKLMARSPALYLKETARKSLIQHECSCWIDLKEDPDHVDPRQPLVATCSDAPRDAKSRLQLRRILRSIAFDFLEDEGGNERINDLTIVLVSIMQASTDSSSRHVRWLAKMIGLEGNSLEHFISQGFSERLAKAREMIVRVEPEFQAIEEYLQGRENTTSDSNESEWVTTASLIRDDLENNREGIWYTSSPLQPELTKRIRGPVLEETSDSEYANGGNKLVLVEALRRHAFLALDDQLNNLPSLGIILLALTTGLGPRGRRWFIRQTSRDLDLPEDGLEYLLEWSRKLLQSEDREGEDWGVIKEAIRMQTEMTLDDETDFPSLSSYSSDSTGSPVPQTEVTGQSSSSASAKKKKKKKKKKN